MLITLSIELYHKLADMPSTLATMYLRGRLEQTGFNVGAALAHHIVLKISKKDFMEFDNHIEIVVETGE